VEKYCEIELAGANVIPFKNNHFPRMAQLST